MEDEPWCIDIALQFDCAVMNGCLVCRLSCPVCMEGMHQCSAMPCVPELLGGNLAPLPGTYPGTPIRLGAGQRM